MDDRGLDDEISLLDIAVVVAENWLLLIIVPLLAGAVAYGVISATNHGVYETEAILSIDQREAALALAAPVLDKAMLESSYLQGYSGSLSQARRLLLEDSFTVKKDTNSEFYRLSVRDEDPQKAEELLDAIIDALVVTSAPNQVELARINRSIEQASASLQELESGLTNINAILARTDDGAAVGGGELGAAVVSLVSSIEQRRAELDRLELAKEGSVRPEDVVQPPTQALVNSRGLLMPVAATVLGVGFVLLILAFIREGFRNAGNDPSRLAQVNRIRRAFWLKPLTAR